MDMFKLMKQAQEMQGKVAAAQKSLETMEVVGTSGSDMVKITMSAKMQVKQVMLSQEAMQDREILEDLLVAALSDAKQKAAKLSEEVMGKATAGLNLPPGFNI